MRNASHRAAAVLLPGCGLGVLLCMAWLNTLGDLRADRAVVWSFVSAWTVWFALLAGAVWAVRRVDVPWALWVIMAVAVGARVLSLGMEPSLSEDWMRYLWDGRLTVNGFDPYAHVPTDAALAELHDDMLLPGMNSPEYHTVYPPVSQSVFAVSWWLGGGDVDRALLALRAIFALVDSAAVLCIVGWLGAIRVDRRWAILYAWNPIAVVELVGTGHSEALLVAPLAGCLWAVARRRDALAGGLLAVAVWVKLFPILAVVPLWRHVGMKRGLRAGVACLIAGLLLGWPMLRPSALTNVTESLGLYAGVFEFNHGPFQTLVAVVSNWTGNAYRIVARGLLGLYLLWVLAWWCVRPGDARKLATILLAIFGGYALANANVFPWSVAWALWLVPAVWTRDVAHQRPALGTPWVWLSFAIGWTYLSVHHPPDGSVPLWVLWTEWGVLIALLLMPVLTWFNRSGTKRDQTAAPAPP